MPPLDSRPIITLLPAAGQYSSKANTATTLTRRGGYSTNHFYCNETSATAAAGIYQVPTCKRAHTTQVQRDAPCTTSARQSFCVNTRAGDDCDENPPRDRRRPDVT